MKLKNSTILLSNCWWCQKVVSRPANVEMMTMVICVLESATLMTTDTCDSAVVNITSFPLMHTPKKKHSYNFIYSNQSSYTIFLLWMFLFKFHLSRHFDLESLRLKASRTSDLSDSHFVNLFFKRITTVFCRFKKLALNYSLLVSHWNIINIYKLIF